jgi:hypothetical protein
MTCAAHLMSQAYRPPCGSMHIGRQLVHAYEETNTSEVTLYVQVVSRELF